MTDIRHIVADNALVDLIERLDSVRITLEEMTTNDQAMRGLVLAEDSLHTAVRFLVQLRAERLGL